MSPASKAREAPKLDPETTYHLQVRKGKTVVHDRLAFGDRATLQVSGRDAEGLLAGGDVELVEPHEVPDVAER
jgi:hypothetical protein